MLKLECYLEKNINSPNRYVPRPCFDVDSGNDGCLKIEQKFQNQTFDISRISLISELQFLEIENH